MWWELHPSESSFLCLDFSTTQIRETALSSGTWCLPGGAYTRRLLRFLTMLHTLDIV